jgi:hypothetical protein
VQITPYWQKSCDRPRLLESQDLDLSELSSLVADVKMIRSWETSLIFYLPPLPPSTRHANHAGDDIALAFDHGRHSDRKAA